MAWLNSTPDKAIKSRYAQFVDGLGVEPDMPETEGCEYLIEYLFRFGPGVANGMGYINVSFAEIHAWAQLVKIRLSGWEAETLHKMSQSYCGQLAISSKKDCPAPWSKMTAESIESNREKIAKGTLDAFRAAARRPQQKPSKKGAQ